MSATLSQKIIATPAPPPWKQRVKKRFEVRVNEFVTVVVCAATLGISGYLAVTLTNPDQGKLVTLEEMHRRVAAEPDRIRNNPHMPAQAKRAAIDRLRAYSSLGRYQSDPK